MVEYKWTAYYVGGETFEQFTDGKENLFGDIDMSRLEAFEFKTEENVPVKTFGLIMPNGQYFINDVIYNPHPELNTEKRKLIAFVRNRKHFAGNFEMFAEEKLYILGFECNVDGEVHNIMYALPSDGLGIVRLHKK